MIKFLQNLYSSTSSALVTSITFLYLVIAILAPYIAPDGSTNANLQVPEFAQLPPFSNRTAIYYSNKTQNPTIIPLLSDTSFSYKNDTLFYQTDQKQAAYLLTSPANQSLIKIKKINYYLGTDQLGRDILSRIIWGSRVSITVGLMSVLIAIFWGTLIGFCSGYFSGIFKDILEWKMAVFWSIPTILLGIIITFSLGKGVIALSIGIGGSLWIELARVTRVEVLTLKEKDFIQAAQIAGISKFRILVVYLLPNLSERIISLACSLLSSAILIESAMSFLGLGVSPPVPSWGGMIFEGYTCIILSFGQWMALFPGIVMLIFIVSIQLFSQHLNSLLSSERL